MIITNYEAISKNESFKFYSKEDASDASDGDGGDSDGDMGGGGKGQARTPPQGGPAKHCRLGGKVSYFA